jgi:hypothetical protein
MTDFHHNIFYYYRGAKQSDLDFDSQLEDNTTKALINTLEHCSSKVVVEFLKWLNIEAAGKSRFELQKKTIGERRIGRKSQRLLLGLVDKGQKSAYDDLEGSVEGDSRPDAWIYGENYVVLIESKVGDASLDPSQMQCHLQKLKAGARQRPRCKVQTWAKVHRFFVGLLPGLSDQDKWLVEQFTQYLEWSSMTEFTGFEEGMFDFFVTRDDEDAVTKKWVRDTMEAFADKILNGTDGMRDFNDAFYRDYNLGNIKLTDDHCWVAFFGPANGDSENFGNWAHQTVAVYNYGLEVFANAELKPAIDRLRKKVHNERQKFVDIVTALPEPFTVRVAERIQRYASLYDDYEVANLKAGVHKKGPYGLKDPESEGFDCFETLLEQIHLPYLSVRKRIDRERALELSERNGDALVNKVVSIMKAFHPLVEFINT